MNQIYGHTIYKLIYKLKGCFFGAVKLKMPIMINILILDMVVLMDILVMDILTLIHTQFMITFLNFKF